MSNAPRRREAIASMEKLAVQTRRDAPPPSLGAPIIPRRSSPQGPEYGRTGRARLRIALLAPVWFPVPPPRYGGIESVVGLLAEALGDAGHDVTVFASGDSTTDSRLSWVYREAPSERLGEALPELRHVLSCYERSDEFDVISDHTGPFAAAMAGLVATPVVNTVHAPLDGELGDIYARIARLSPDLRLISLSQSQRRPRPYLPWFTNCPNAVDPARFPWGRERGDYLLFLGRMGPEKGAHHAIAVAEELGLPLKIAAKCREPGEHAYFTEFVEPHLAGRIEYLGEVDHAQKAELLRNARVTLFPIDWQEPFGMVMIESLACGTPVVATRRGSVPEVLEHGRTGIIVDDHRDLAKAVAEADGIDRAECRCAVEERFGPGSLSAAYLAAFRTAIEGGSHAPTTGSPRSSASSDKLTLLVDQGLARVAVDAHVAALGRRKA
jgi:glycosyltransferase involved in cell wall biosynthesis